MFKKLKLGLVALLLPALALAQSYPSPTFQNLSVLGTGTFVNATVTGTLTANVSLASLPQQAANTLLGNAGSVSAVPSAVSVTGCNGAAQALQWTNGAGFQCNSSIATSGSNSNITSLSGLTTPLSAAQGGLGVASPTQYAVLVGNGSSAISVASPSTAGYALISNGASANPSFQPVGLIGIQVFTSSGTYNSDTGTKAVIVEEVGGGGGGGGCPATSSSQVCLAGSGESGSYAKVYMTSGFTGGITVTIGAAGSGGAAGANNGTAGGTTSFGAAISCPGGGYGGSALVTSTSPSISGVAGGTASECTVSSGTTLSLVKGYDFISQTLGASGTATGGNGGASPLGDGGEWSAGGAGRNAGGHGGGGSGASLPVSSSAVAGGNGSGGEVIVYEYN